jgi:hypothetical protein
VSRVHEVSSVVSRGSRPFCEPLDIDIFCRLQTKWDSDCRALLARQWTPRHPTAAPSDTIRQLEVKFIVRDSREQEPATR